MRQKSIGALPGIYGRLGNLGGIDNKYDVAISTAAGEFLLVVRQSMKAVTLIIQ